MKYLLVSLIAFFLGITIAVTSIWYAELHVRNTMLTFNTCYMQGNYVFHPGLDIRPAHALKGEEKHFLPFVGHHIAIGSIEMFYASKILGSIQETECGDFFQ